MIIRENMDRLLGGFGESAWRQALAPNEEAKSLVRTRPVVKKV